jgi:UDP-GlcNAc:undecaprenyl-phosphate GlcNAc-1-phosphate transferase
MIAVLINTISTFVLSVLFITVLQRASVIFSLVDHPSGRKQHHGAIPLCGGISIFSAFAIVSLLSGELQALGINFWLGLLVIVGVGVVDDRHPLPAAGRLITQLSVAAVFVAGVDFGSLSLGDLLPQNVTGLLPAFFVIGIFFVAGLVNSWNMLDGVDGLAGGAAAVALIWLMIIAGFAGASEITIPLQMLLVGLCAFLIFNMRSPWRVRASVFLGDAGSTALGATISYSILLLATGKSGVSFPALLWIVIVPVVDTLSLMARRVLAHRSPMSADRWHLHHLLLDNGLTPAMTTNVLIMTSAVCGAIGYAGIRAHVPDGIMALGLLVPVSAHTLFVLAATGPAARARLGRLEPKAKTIGREVVKNEAPSQSTRPGRPNFEL